MKYYIPESWLRVRAIDYHEHVKWAVLFVALSQYNEMFVYDYLNIDPERNTTSVIANQIKDKSGYDKFGMNLIDPLANKTQTNTGTSVVGDLNHIFRVFKHEGLCSGGVWEGWDTKSTLGRDRLRERIINSETCREPFNNEQVENGQKKRLPTIWVFNHCKPVADSLHKWRLDKTGKPEQAWSHFCTALEAILKDERFRPRVERPVMNIKRAKEYFKVRHA